MSRRADQVISIRVPQGLPDELRELTNVPFSTLARNVLINLLNNERAKAQRKTINASNGVQDERSS